MLVWYVIVASLASIFPSGGEMSPRAVVGSLVPSLGGDGDRYGGRIDAADTPVRRRGIRDGDGRVLCGLG